MGTYLLCTNGSSVAHPPPGPSPCALALQVVHQLLQVYQTLLPALRHSALRNCPRWATEAAGLSDHGTGTGPARARVLSSGGGRDPAAGVWAGAGQGAIDGGGADHAQLQSSHTFGDRQGSESGAGTGAGTEAAGRDADAALLCAPALSEHSSLPPPHPNRGASPPAPRSQPASSTHSRTGSWSGSGVAPSVGTGVGGGTVDASGEDGATAAALFGTWAGAAEHMQWKSLQWVVQVGLLGQGNGWLGGNRARLAASFLVHA